jgi:hypothetical protein
LFDLLEPWDVRVLSIMKTADYDRVYVKIVLYLSVTPLSEGKMVMNE